MFFRYSAKAFTLAEFLIALAILGIIATFSIPKVLQSQQSAEKRAMAKEVIAMVSGAYEAYKKQTVPSASTGGHQLIPYMNYVTQISDGSLDIDSHNNWTSVPCDAFWVCLRLHNGGVLAIPDVNFADTGPRNALNFVFDPDGKYDGGAAGSNHPGKGLQFHLYFNGRITTAAHIEPDTDNSTWTDEGPDPNTDPVWWKGEW